MFSQETTTKTLTLLKTLKEKNLRVCTAESCTAGLLSAALTEIPGASDAFERGYVTYSNESKIELLTVPTFFIEDYGAVSMETVIAMAEGALLMSKADISIAVSGVAGPDGGSEDKPVGTVYVASSYKNHGTIYERLYFSGGRHSIRMQTVEAGIDLAIKHLIQ